MRYPPLFILLIKIMGMGVLEEQLNIFVQSAVVAFERKHIVGFLSDNLFGNRFLAAHRIHRNHAPHDVQELQQRGNSRNLIASAIDFDLSQCQAAFGGPCTH